MKVVYRIKSHVMLNYPSGAQYNYLSNESKKFVDKNIILSYFKDKKIIKNLFLTTQIIKEV